MSRLRKREREREREERGSIVWHLGHLDHGCHRSSRELSTSALARSPQPREANDDNHGLWEQTMAMTATEKAMRRPPLTTRGRARCPPTCMRGRRRRRRLREGATTAMPGRRRGRGSERLSGDRMDINWYVHAAKVPQFSSR